MLLRRICETESVILVKLNILVEVVHAYKTGVVVKSLRRGAPAKSTITQRIKCSNSYRFYNLLAATEHVPYVISYKVKVPRYSPIVHTYNLFQLFRLALVVSGELAQFHCNSYSARRLINCLFNYVFSFSIGGWWWCFQILVLLQLFFS